MLEQNGLWIAIACGLLAVVYGAVSVQWILARSAGNERMQQIAVIPAQLLGLRVARIPIGMELHGALAVRLLDLIGGGAARHTQQFVVISAHAVVRSHPSVSRLLSRRDTTATAANVAW